MMKILFLMIIAIGLLGSLYAQEKDTKVDVAENKVSIEVLKKTTDDGTAKLDKLEDALSKKLTAHQILQKIDSNVHADSRRIESRMVVYNRRGRKRTMKSIGYSIGDTKSFSEYIAPKKEKGVKMLKIGDNLWNYNPRTDRIIRIAGHLLRQSVMGSDLSYEDSLEDRKVSDIYNATIIKEDEVNGQKVWVLGLVANKKDIAYPRRKMWVDQDKFLPLRELWYGKSGKVLKKIEIRDIKFISGRWYPVVMYFKDVLKSGKGTEFIMDKIEFNPEIPESTFSKQNLRK
ncbi:outer membrane lipoprotein-sorting protein [bacterium]|nr:outer membrane lipoprotein-sorting protein [bacterium]